MKNILISKILALIFRNLAKASQIQKQMVEDSPFVNGKPVIEPKNKLDSLKDVIELKAFQKEHEDHFKYAKTADIENVLGPKEEKHKFSNISYDKEAKQARDFLKLSILDVRALKNRLGGETIADFLILYEEYKIRTNLIIYRISSRTV